MPKILRRLRIDEVSSVDRGAGVGVKILLLKRDNDHSVIDMATEALAESVVSILADEDDSLDKAAALSKTFEQFSNHLKDNFADEIQPQSITKTTKDTPMDRLSELRDIAKQDGGMIAIAKHIIAKGSTAITEHEYSAALMAHCRLNKIAGETDAGAFSRIFSDPASFELRAAHAITKNTPAPMMSIEPTAVEVTDINDASKAYNKLTEMAEDQRRRAPTLTPAQAFARVFEENPELAAKAHRRPEATTSFAMPR
jgi:hypothetical protein